MKTKLCRRGISSGPAGSVEEGAHGGGIDGDGARVGGGIRLLAARLSVEAIPTSLGDHIPRMELEGLKVLAVRHDGGEICYLARCVLSMEARELALVKFLSKSQA